jgi:hypothetical protein
MPKTMKPIFFTPALLLLVLVTTCKKEEDPKPDANYAGVLKLEYSRTFPEFSAVEIMDVVIDKSGYVLISEPDQVPYSGEDEMNLDDGKIKLNETGAITLTSLSGDYKEINGKGYLSVHASTLIEGTQKTWAWDDQSGWILLGEVPFSIEDPVESPMDFKLEDAITNLSGVELGATVQTPPFGSMTFTWVLWLLVTAK